MSYVKTFQPYHRAYVMGLDAEKSEKYFSDTDELLKLYIFFALIHIQRNYQLRTVRALLLV